MTRSKRSILPSLLALLVAAPVVSAQESITWEQLEELLDPYFAPELVGDVEKSLPAGDFDVWGFDVGDYSGDGYNDLIISLRMRSSRSREMKVYYFVDIQGIVELVRQETATFVELPIEVGVTIGDGLAYLITKRSEDDWRIKGRQFRDGVITLVDMYTTDRNTVYTHEKYRNFRDLEGFDRFLRVRNDEEAFRNDFLAVPSYRRGRHVPAGYSQTARATMSAYVVRGAYWRSGESDLVVGARSAWDRDYLYFNVLVNDDEVVPYVYNNDSLGDRVEIWIDMSPFSSRFLTGKNDRRFRLHGDTNIYGFRFDLGDLADKEPSATIATTNLFDDVQTRATSKIRAFASRTDSGWSLKARIPFQVFNYREAPVPEGELLEIGGTVVVRDIDNKWRPEEETVMATSHKFDSEKPATFGEIILVPKGLFYGESENIFLGEVRERLDEIGY